MSIGEAGSLTANTPVANAPITVTLTEPLTDPVIVLTGTQEGGHPYTLRVLDTTTDADGNVTSFTFTIEEWEYLDGAHPVEETINWVAVEEGVHTLPDGRTIEAGFASADDTGTAVTLQGDFDSAPVVVTSVMSTNDTTSVDSDPTNITTTGFDVSLQEEEAQDGTHAQETVGWIAIEPGAGAVTDSTVTHVPTAIDLGDTFADPITVADTQTQNGGNPETVQIDSINGSDEATVFLQEEQSGDSETNHVPETVGLVTFEQGLIPCFTPGALILTDQGPRPVETLRPGDLLITRDHGAQPLRWVCRRTLSAADLRARPQLRPVILRKDSLAPGVPDRDMAVSPQHRMLLDGWRAELLYGASEVLAPARGLVNDLTVRSAGAEAPVTYIHLLLDRHEIIRADNAWTESLHAGQLNKGLIPGPARDELFALFPGLRAYEQSYGPTARPVTTVRETRALYPVSGAARTR